MKQHFAFLLLQKVKVNTLPLSDRYKSVHVDVNPQNENATRSGCDNKSQARASGALFLLTAMYSNFNQYGLDRIKRMHYAEEF